MIISLYYKKQKEESVMECNVENRQMEEKDAYQSPTVSNIAAEPFVFPAMLATAVVSGVVSGAVSAVVAKAVG